MKCMAEALSCLSKVPQADVQRVLNRFGPSPWGLIECVYAADYFKIILCPFVHEADGRVYPQFYRYYENYDGILLGRIPGQEIGHALAKVDGKLIGPNYVSSCWKGWFTELGEKIFLAKMN
jgi:hypothetical protein